MDVCPYCGGMVSYEQGDAFCIDCQNEIFEDDMDMEEEFSDELSYFGNEESDCAEGDSDLW